MNEQLFEEMVAEGVDNLHEVIAVSMSEKGNVFMAELVTEIKRIAEWIISDGQFPKELLGETERFFYTYSIKIAREFS